MKIKSLFASVMASVMAFVACENEKVDLGTPSIALSLEEVTLEAAGGKATVDVTATRDWTVKFDETADWLVVDPASGTASADAQQVTISALSNEGYDREVSVEFSIGMQTKYLTVKQAGPKGSADELVVYSNDMDNGKVEKVNDNWPYPDQSDAWRNEKGTGIQNVKYSSNGVSVRSVSSTNNIWFPAKGGSYLSIQNIALNSTSSLQLTFDAVHGSPNGYKKSFSTSVFKVFVSKDAQKWVELPYELTENAENEFDTASAEFTVEGVDALSITFQFLGAEDGYRLTDINLLAYEGEDAVAVDFSKAEAKDFGAGSTGGNNNGGNTGGEVTPPTDAIFFESFASGKGDFTIEDKTLPEGLTYVWYEDTQYKNMKASAFKDNVKYAAESWLISPEVDLTSVTAAYLLFEHTGKYFGTMADEATVYARKAGGEWAKLTIPTYMSGNDWTFVSSGAIDLKDYIGGKMQFAFKYVSTSNAAGTWEIKNVCVSATAEITGDDPGDDDTSDGGAAEDFESGTYSYAFEKGVVKSSGNLVLANLAWNLGVEWKAEEYFGWDGNSNKGVQLGSGSNPATKITLRTEAIKGTIKSVKVNTSGAKDTDAILSVTVGGNAFGQAATLTNTATDYTFEGSATGALELVWTLTQKAVYVKSIEVVVE